MTTSRLRAGHHWSVSGGFDDDGCALVAVVAGGASLLVTTAVGFLYLHNLYGPFGEHARWGAIAGLASGLVPAVTAAMAGWYVARRSRTLGVLLVGVVAAASWVVLPRQIDLSESWRPEANPRWSCTGWSFRHYPPATYDADATTYCIGLEKRIPDG